jgi:PAS domain S-box-containing protein
MATPIPDVHGDLKESPLLLQTVLDNLPVGVMIADCSGKVLMINKAMQSVWQGKRQLQGFDNYREYMAWDTRTGCKVEPHQWPISVAIRTGQPTGEYEFQIERFDGTCGYMLTKAVPIQGADGEVTGAVGVSQDITARKEAEETTKKSESRFRSVLDSSLDVIYRYNLKTGCYEYMSPSITRLGFTPEEMTSMADEEVFTRVHPDDLPALKQELAHLSQTGIGYSEYRFKGKDGIYRWWSNQLIIIKDDKGQPLYRDGYVRDITQQKADEEQLKESEQLYRVLFDNTDDLFTLIKPIPDNLADFKILKVNEAFERTLGRPASEYEGKRISEVTPTIQKTSIIKFNQVAKTGRSTRFESYNHDRKMWFELFAFPYKQNQVGVLFRDITGRKKTEEALKLSGQRIHEILESITDDFMVLDRNWNYVYANSQAARLVGLEPNTIVGKNFWDLFPQNRGTEIERNLKEAMEHREMRRFELDGQYSKKCKIITTYPSVEGIALIATDITERKNLEKQLQEKERLAAIGSTAGMVGHDIRNPLQAMMSDVFLLKQLLTSMPHMPTKTEVEESLDGLEKNIAYVNKIVADLQDYARPLKPEYSQIDAADIVNSVLKNVALPDNIKLELSVAAPQRFSSEATFIRRSLTNLVNNALQAMPDGGTLSISAKECHDKVAFTVIDTGVGIPDDVKPKLFSPMMTTKSKGQGLGLAVVKRLIEGIGGRVTVESQVGKGTEFTIELPTAPVHTEM